jgi:hypothetical protein
MHRLLRWISALLPVCLYCRRRERRDAINLTNAATYQAWGCLWTYRPAFDSRRWQNLISSIFSDVMQRRLLVTDVLGQPIGPVFKCHADPWRSHLYGVGSLKSRHRICLVYRCVQYRIRDLFSLWYSWMIYPRVKLVTYRQLLPRLRMRGSVTYDHPYALNVSCLDGRRYMLVSAAVTSNTACEMCLTCAGDRIATWIARMGGLAWSDVASCGGVLAGTSYFISGWYVLVFRRFRKIAKSDY